MLVIEEYDKLDCAMRGFFRQLLENGRIANVTLNRYCCCCISCCGSSAMLYPKWRCLAAEWQACARHCLCTVVAKEGSCGSQASLALSFLRVRACCSWVRSSKLELYCGTGLGLD